MVRVGLVAFELDGYAGRRGRREEWWVFELWNALTPTKLSPFITASQRL